MKFFIFLAPFRINRTFQIYVDYLTIQGHVEFWVYYERSTLTTCYASSEVGKTGPQTNIWQLTGGPVTACTLMSFASVEVPKSHRQKYSYAYLKWQRRASAKSRLYDTREYKENNCYRARNCKDLKVSAILKGFFYSKISKNWKVIQLKNKR